MIQVQEPVIYLNESTHQYFYTPTNKELMAVTFVFEKMGITDFSKVPFERLEPARVKGDHVHAMAMYYALKMLDESSIDEEYFGYYDAIRKFFKERVKKIIAVEQPVYSLQFGYAGTPDIIYLTHDDKLVLDDWKTPLKLHVACKWQTAGYVYPWEKMHKQKIDERAAVQLLSNGDYFRDVHKNPLRRDFDEFLTFLKAAQMKVQNKIK